MTAPRQPPAPPNWTSISWQPPEPDGSQASEDWRWAIYPLPDGVFELWEYDPPWARPPEFRGVFPFAYLARGKARDLLRGVDHEASPRQ